MIMKLHELVSVSAVVEAGFNVTLAAEQLHTSQPGISRHVKQVEEELGVALFERRKNRYVGLTPAGALLLPMLQRTLRQLDELKHAARGCAEGQLGSLTVATSHTHARYLLPQKIERFIHDHPNVKLRIRQGYLQQIAEWLSTGEADVSVSSTINVRSPDLLFIPCGELHRVVITKPDHPLLSKADFGFNDLAKFPIITYDREFAARAQIENEFARHGLTANIVLSATDTDTVKAYVECGLGIGIVANSAFDPDKDHELEAIDARHLFPSTVIHIGLRRTSSIGASVRHFIGLFVEDVDAAVSLALSTAPTE